MDKIQILHIIPLLTFGGAEEKLVYILKKVDKSLFSNHVIYAIPGPFKEEIEKEGVTNIRIYPMSLMNPLSFISQWHIYRYIKKNRIDIVHCHLDIAYILGGISAIFAGIPIIFSFQNIADERVISFYRVFKYFERFFSIFTHKIIVESEDVEKNLLSWGIKKEKLIILPNGVEIPDRIKMSYKTENLKKELGIENCMIIGNIARLIDLKNHKLLLRAAAKVIHRKQDTRVLIIGDGPMKDELKKLSHTLGISKYILFLDSIKDIEPYLMVFDIFALTSFTESTPMALLHALAYRLPVVTTAVGDIPSFIRNGINGVLVASDDHESLSSAILDLLKDHDKRRKIANAGFELAKEKYNIQTMIKGIEQIYFQNIKNIVTTDELSK